VQWFYLPDSFSATAQVQHQQHHHQQQQQQLSDIQRCQSASPPHSPLMQGASPKRLSKHDFMKLVSAGAYSLQEATEREWKA